MTVFVFYAVAFDPIKIQACQTHQNDLLNLIFVKDIHVVCKKITRNGPKRVIFEVYYDFLRYRRYFNKNYGKESYSTEVPGIGLTNVSPQVKYLQCSQF